MTTKRAIVLIAFAAVAVGRVSAAQEMIGDGQFDAGTGRLELAAELRGFTDSGRVADFFIQAGLVNNASGQTSLNECHFFDTVSTEPYGIDSASCTSIAASDDVRQKVLFGSLSQDLRHISAQYRIRNFFVTQPEEIDILFGLGNTQTGEFVLLQLPVAQRAAVPEPGILGLMAVGILLLTLFYCRDQSATRETGA